MQECHDGCVGVHEQKERAKKFIVRFSYTIIYPRTMMVPHIDALGALVAVPTAPGLQHFAFEANVDANVLVDLFQKLSEFVLT